MAEAEKKTRAKKGEGPYVLMFVDKENKEAARVPEAVDALKVTDKESKKTKTYSVSALPPATLHQLAADGLKRRLDASIRNNIGGEKDAIVLADEMYAQIKSGKLYTKKEGGKGGAGRTFDFDLWVSAIERLAKLRNEANPKAQKLATKQQLAAVRTKLEASTPQERNVIIGKWKKDPMFVLAKKQVDAESAATSMKDKKAGAEEVNALADLF